MALKTGPDFGALINFSDILKDLKAAGGAAVNTAKQEAISRVTTTVVNSPGVQNALSESAKKNALEVTQQAYETGFQKTVVFLQENKKWIYTAVGLSFAFFAYRRFAGKPGVNLAHNPRRKRASR